MTTLLLLIVLAQGVTDESILIGMEGPANSFSVDEENLGMHLVIPQASCGYPVAWYRGSRQPGSGQRQAAG